ncbi:MAG: hypothetical protein R3E32_19270 [Chitinophagales bacterium]
MKNLLFLFLLTAITSIMTAQIPKESIENQTPENQNKIESQEWYQIHLEKPIQRIEEIFYDNEEKTPIENEISKDRQSIILKNYSKKGRVKVRLVFEDGGEVIETITKSSCFIDPVIPL